MTENKQEEQILFPEAKVGDIVIKPWSFGILFEISTMLEGVLDKVKEKEIDLSIGFLSYVDMIRLFTIANKDVRKIIAITVNRTEEEINALSMEDGIKIAMLIYQGNATILKNAISSLIGNQSQVTESAKESNSEEEK